MNTAKSFQKELDSFQNKGGIPCFEYKLVNGDYLLLDIYITGQYIKAEGEKDFSVRIDSAFSLDEHLQALSEKITDYYGDSIDWLEGV